MSDSSIDTVEVTDDLDAFSELMFNPKAPEPVVEPEDAPEDDEAPGSPPDDTVVEEGDESEPEDESDDHEEDDLEAKVDDEDDEEDKSLFKVKPRKSAKERIQELARKANDATARADALARELEEARAKKVEEPKVPVQTAKVEGPDPEEANEDGSPKYPLGEFDPKYITDLTRFTIRQEKEAIDRADAERRERDRIETAERELTSSWNEKVKNTAEALPDLPEKTAGLESEFRSLDPQYGNYLAQTIMSLEFGPQVLDYLADNIDEARSIVAAGPTRATLALGRIEARFASKKSDEKKEVKTAAPPPPPRTRGSGGSVGIAADTDDLDAFEKLYFKR